MPRFVKKPIEIEAFQMTKERRWDNSEWPDWLNIAWDMEPSDPGCLYCIDDDGLVGPGERLCITTLEGTHAVTFGDWIIKGVKGELYPCKPDIFEATYEQIGEVVAGPFTASRNCACCGETFEQVGPWPMYPMCPPCERGQPGRSA